VLVIMQEKSRAALARRDRGAEPNDGHCERPVNFILDGGGKKEVDEFVERSLYRSASMSDHQRVTSNGTQFSGVRKSPFRWDRARWCVLVVGGRLGRHPGPKTHWRLAKRHCAPSNANKWSRALRSDIFAPAE
jgi:hypothetical protein